MKALHNTLDFIFNIIRYNAHGIIDARKHFRIESLQNDPKINELGTSIGKSKSDIKKDIDKISKLDYYTLSSLTNCRARR